MGGAAGGAEALIVDRCAHHQEVAAGETSHPALITYTNLIDSDHMGNLSPPTPGHWRYPSVRVRVRVTAKTLITGVSAETTYYVYRN